MDNSKWQLLKDKLNRSKFRSGFKLGQKEKDYFLMRGEDVIRRHAYDFIRKRLSLPYPQNDGRQTPMRGHPVFIAQHATAVCCRKCLNRWHKIAIGKRLNEDQINYVVEIIMSWLKEQMK
jgi:hypothetical protein